MSIDVPEYRTKEKKKKIVLELTESELKALSSLAQRLDQASKNNCGNSSNRD